MRRVLDFTALCLDLQRIQIGRLAKIARIDPRHSLVINICGMQDCIVDQQHNRYFGMSPRCPREAKRTISGNPSLKMRELSCLRLD